MKFPTVQELERHIRMNLVAGDPARVKDTLSSIVYWGHYRAGIRDFRVERFRSRVTAEQMARAATVCAQLSGPGILELRGLRMPEFSNFAFLSKLRTFLDPEKYCVLDKKLLKLPDLEARVKQERTFIPVNAGNIEAYLWWVGLCGRIAAALLPPRRPVDVERGFFHLVDTGESDAAASILRQAVTI